MKEFFNSININKIFWIFQQILTYFLGPLCALVRITFRTPAKLIQFIRLRLCSGLGIRISTGCGNWELSQMSKTPNLIILSSQMTSIFLMKKICRNSDIVPYFAILHCYSWNGVPTSRNPLILFCQAPKLRLNAYYHISRKKADAVVESQISCREM